MTFLENYKTLLLKADIEEEPRKYILKLFLFSQLVVVFVIFFLLLIFLIRGESILPLILLYFVFSLIIFAATLTRPSMRITAKKTNIDFDLVYTVRHLLRLESGLSLLNAIEEVSNLKTKSSKLFSKLIFEIEMGSTLKQAVHKSLRYSVSRQYSKVLGNIKTSLETGSDLVTSLKNTLNELVVDKKDTIQSYGKRLNPITMFYMIFGTILPSVGASVLILATSFIGFIGEELGRFILIVFAIFIFVVQLSFYLVFNALRPKVF